jgi:hypothetical protein
VPSDYRGGTLTLLASTALRMRASKLSTQQKRTSNDRRSEMRRCSQKSPYTGTARTLPSSSVARSAASYDSKRFGRRGDQGRLSMILMISAGLKRRWPDGRWAFATRRNPSHGCAQFRHRSLRTLLTVQRRTETDLCDVCRDLDAVPVRSFGVFACGHRA